MQHVLVVCAHPDDAELMVGGTIALLTARKVRVTVALFTTSAGAVSGRARRKAAAREAAAILGHEIIWVEEGAFEHVVDIQEPRCVALIDELLHERRPDLVMAHAATDSHCDHAQIGRCVVAAARNSNAQFFAFGPSEYRTQPSNAFVPNVFVDISNYVGQKYAAIECYNYDGAPFRKLRADEIVALNRANGVRCGAEHAEALQVVRQFGIPSGMLGVPHAVSLGNGAASAGR